MSEAYQKNYLRILNDNGIPNIFENKVQKSQANKKKQLFPKCEQKDIPEFFRTNLVSPNRIIKYVFGQYCVYRAFYFQLFKLIFQIQDQERDYVQVFKQIVFDPDLIQRNGENSRAKRQMRNSAVRDQSSNDISEQEGFRRQFEMHQKAVGQFMEVVLQNAENFSSFEQYLPYYPQVDESISFILQTFIDNAEENMDSIQSIFEYLSQLFEIQLVVFENCFKFQQSDVFLYIEQKHDQQVWIYIAYNQNDEEEQQVGNPKGSQLENNHDHSENTFNEEEVSSDRISRHNSRLPLNQSPSIKSDQIKSDTLHVSAQKNQRSSSYYDKVITSQSKQQFSPHIQQNLQHQEKDFHKKNAYQNVVQHIEQKGSDSEISKQQSQTQNYRQDQFNKTHSMNQISHKSSPNQKNYLNRKESEIKDQSSSQKITDSKNDTIINMFGDMLASTTNIGSFDQSQKGISAMFGSVKNVGNNQPQRDNDGFLEANAVNMKKNKTQKQLIIEAKPSSSFAESYKQQQSRTKITSFQGRRNLLAQIKVQEMLIDSQQLRDTDEHQMKMNNNLREESLHIKGQTNSSLKNGSEYFDNIEARSYMGETEGNHKSSIKNAQSFHESPQLLADLGQLNIEAPFIKVNSVKSHSQSSSIELNNRNNYYQNDEDLLFTNRPKQSSCSYHYHQIQNYKNQQYVSVNNIQSASIPKPSSRLQTISHQTNEMNGIGSTENKEEDDFFFRPDKHPQKYLMNTINQLRASKQNSKPEYELASKISYMSSKYSQVSQNLKQKDSLISQKPYQNKLSKIFNSKVYEKKKQQIKEIGDDSINNGTFYKQFTNSKVLKLLKQPYRTKVQILKNRFKGEHRTNINTKFIS